MKYNCIDLKNQKIELNSKIFIVYIHYLIFLYSETLNNEYIGRIYQMSS